MKRTIFRPTESAGAIFVWFAGLVPALLLTKTFRQAVEAGLMISVGLLLSDLLTAACGRLPETARRVAAPLLPAGAAALMTLLARALLPRLFVAAGWVLPLSIYTCGIISEVENRAGRDSGSGKLLAAEVRRCLELLLLLLPLGLLREILGFGRLFSAPDGEGGMLLFSGGALPLFASVPGAFLLLALMAALRQALVSRRNREAEPKRAEELLPPETPAAEPVPAAPLSDEGFLRNVVAMADDLPTEESGEEPEADRELTDVVSAFMNRRAGDGGEKREEKR